jgi:hypothetical protein
LLIRSRMLWVRFLKRVIHSMFLLAPIYHAFR